MAKKSLKVMAVFFCLVVFTGYSRGQTTFTQQDREMLIELKTRMNEIDKRISDLREDMNKRFEQADKRFEQIDKRFEQLDKRFEQVDKRFEQMLTFIGILAALFAAITVGIFGFALWDRRTMTRPFEVKTKDIEKELSTIQKKYDTLVAALKGYAENNKKFSEIVHRFNLF